MILKVIKYLHTVRSAPSDVAGCFNYSSRACLSAGSPRPYLAVSSPFNGDETDREKKRGEKIGQRLAD